MQIEFLTKMYQSNHGAPPRGRGFWRFSFEGHQFEHKGTFAEAKKACVAAVRAKAPVGYQATVFVEVES